MHMYVACQNVHNGHTPYPDLYGDSHGVEMPSYHHVAFLNEQLAAEHGLNSRLERCSGAALTWFQKFSDHR